MASLFVDESFSNAEIMSHNPLIRTNLTSELSLCPETAVEKKWNVTFIYLFIYFYLTLFDIWGYMVIRKSDQFLSIPAIRLDE